MERWTYRHTQRHKGIGAFHDEPWLFKSHHVGTKGPVSFSFCLFVSAFIFQHLVITAFVSIQFRLNLLCYCGHKPAPFTSTSSALHVGPFLSLAPSFHLQACFTCTKVITTCVMCLSRVSSVLQQVSEQVYPALSLHDSSSLVNPRSFTRL